MTAQPSSALQAFYLAAPAGQRFCVYHPAAAEVTARGGILYVHPFTEEMNKSRAMAAAQARRWSQQGWVVLQIDLTGCGDSDGDFSDATWDAWLADLAAAWQELQHRSTGPCWLWGARLGGLLAASFAATRPQPAPAGLLLWQPVTSGALHLKQFLRLRTVGGLLNQDGAATDKPADSVQSLLAELQAGQTLEVAGYGLNPQLALPLQGIELARIQALPARVHWFEVATQAGANPTPSASPASQRIVEVWRQQESRVDLSVVSGPAFWQTQEIEFCPELLAASSAALADA